MDVIILKYELWVQIYNSGPGVGLGLDEPIGLLINDPGCYPEFRISIPSHDEYFVMSMIINSVSGCYISKIFTYIIKR